MPFAAPRLCVSALSGGGGKTLLSLGLARAFRRRGVVVMPFKKGPDYIDAAWLSLAAGRDAGNLDLFFLQADALRALFFEALQAASAEGLPAMGLIEGNRGLFDGLDDAGSCSTAELARVLDCPVLLSLNCTKLTRTAAALVRGVTAFEPGLRFCGVVLSQVGSARHESALRRALEQYTDLPVLGALPRLQPNPLPERQMGIACRSERLADDAEQTLEMLADFTAAHLDLDAVAAAARTAPDISSGPLEPCPAARSADPAAGHSAAGVACAAEVAGSASSASQVVQISLPKGQRPRIGYVRDAALWFYYRENLEALSRAGAEPVCLSLLDARPSTAPAADLWQDLDGLYLGGGFPEDHAAQLAASPQLAFLAAAAQQGLPVYAECGGFMVLARAIARGADIFPMSNIFPVTARFCARPQGLGYVTGRVQRENPYFPVGLALRGHEFHYSRCEWVGPQPVPAFALALERGTGMGRSVDKTHAGDGLLYKRVWASYTHIFAPAVPCWAVNFVAAAQAYGRERRLAGSGCMPPNMPPNVLL